MGIARPVAQRIQRLFQDLAASSRGGTEEDLADERGGARGAGEVEEAAEEGGADVGLFGGGGDDWWRGGVPVWEEGGGGEAEEVVYALWGEEVFVEEVGEEACKMDELVE